MLKCRFKIIGLFVILLLFISLSGCATIPSREEMIKQIDMFQLPASTTEFPNMALIFVVRPSSAGALVRFNIFVDADPERDKVESTLEAGYTRGDQHIYFYVEPGIHTIYSKAENAAKIEMRVEAGKIYFIKQNVEMGFIMARNTLELIDDVEGKYWVKETDLGTIKRKTFEGIHGRSETKPDETNPDDRSPDEKKAQ